MRSGRGFKPAAGCVPTPCEIQLQLPAQRRPELLLHLSRRPGPPALANKKKRAVRNIIHASGTVEEAKEEIDLWFKPEEIVKYRRTDEGVMFE